MNRASLDRGFGRCMLMRKHGTVLKRYPNRTSDIISQPSMVRPPGQYFIGWSAARRAAQAVSRAQIRRQLDAPTYSGQRVSAAPASCGPGAASRSLPVPWHLQADWDEGAAKAAGPSAGGGRPGRGGGGDQPRRCVHPQGGAHQHARHPAQAGPGDAAASAALARGKSTAVAAGAAACSLVHWGGRASARLHVPAGPGASPWAAAEVQAACLLPQVPHARAGRLSTCCAWPDVQAAAAVVEGP